jgi:hypothetical protein
MRNQGSVDLCWALTIVLRLPHCIREAPEAREKEENSHLGGSRVPQQEGNDAGEVSGCTCSERGRQDSELATVTQPKIARASESPHRRNDHLYSLLPA